MLQNMRPGPAHSPRPPARGPTRLLQEQAAIGPSPTSLLDSLSMAGCQTSHLAQALSFQGTKLKTARSTLLALCRIPPSISIEAVPTHKVLGLLDQVVEGVSADFKVKPLPLHVTAMTQDSLLMVRGIICVCVCRVYKSALNPTLSTLCIVVHKYAIIGFSYFNVCNSSVSSSGPRLSTQQSSDQDPRFGEGSTEECGGV